MRSILNEKNLRSKKILLRLDLNVPLKNRKIIDTTRIDKILPTLIFLIKQKTKIIIISHVGRPKGKLVKELSMEPICEYLEKKMSQKIRLIKTNINNFKGSSQGHPKGQNTFSSDIGIWGPELRLDHLYNEGWSQL